MRVLPPFEVPAAAHALRGELRGPLRELAELERRIGELEKRPLAVAAEGAGALLGDWMEAPEPLKFAAERVTCGLRILGTLARDPPLAGLLLSRDAPLLLQHIPSILSALPLLERHVPAIMRAVLTPAGHLRSVSPHLASVLRRLRSIDPHLPWIMDNIDALAPSTGLLMRHVDELLLYAAEGEDYGMAEQLLPYRE
jgi:hypothetical protein